MKILNHKMWKNVEIEMIAKIERIYAGKIKLIMKQEVFGPIL